MKNLFLILLAILLFSACKKDNDNPESNEVIGWTAGDPIDGYGTILYTKDGGDNWVRQGNANQIPDIVIPDICAVSSSTAWACGDSIHGYGTILKTTDGGQNWVRQGVGKGIPAVSFTSISAVNADIAFAVGFGGTVVKTIDGGNSWQIQAQGLVPTAELQRIYAFDQNIVWAVGTSKSEDTFIIHTSDGGYSWKRQGENDVPPEMVGLIDVHAISPSYAWAVGTAAGTMRTTDGGQYWESITTPIGIGHNNGICLVNDTTTWVAADYCAIFNYSSDTSQHWISHSVSCNTEALWPVLLGVTVLDESKIWVVGSSGGLGVAGDIFYSPDGGKSWKTQTNPVKVNLRRVSFVGAMR